MRPEECLLSFSGLKKKGGRIKNRSASPEGSKTDRREVFKF